MELFHVFTGKGRNGKSKLNDLIKYTYGECYNYVPSTLLTREQPNAHNPRPELLELRNKKIVLSSEPDNKNKLNGGFIKSLTEKDPITCRQSYSAKINTFSPNFGLIILCNDIPEFDKNDEAIRDRCMYIEFPTKFVDNPTLKNGEKRMIN